MEDLVNNYSVKNIVTIGEIKVKIQQNLYTEELVSRFFDYLKTEYYPPKYLMNKEQTSFITWTNSDKSVTLFTDNRDLNYIPTSFYSFIYNKLQSFLTPDEIRFLDSSPFHAYYLIDVVILYSEYNPNTDTTVYVVKIRF